MFTQVFQRARHGVGLTPSMRVMNRANIHTSPRPANNTIQPPSSFAPSSINSDSKPTIPRQVSIESPCRVETISASEAPIQGTDISKFLLFILALLLLDAFASFNPEDFPDTFRIVERYSIDVVRYDILALENPEQLLMSQGEDLPRITALTFSEEQGYQEDDLEYLGRLIPESRCEINEVRSALGLLEALLQITGKDGEQVIVLPEEPTIPHGKLSVELYGFLFKKVVQYLVLEKGFTVVAPFPNAPRGAYAKGLPYMFTYDYYAWPIVCSPDFFISPEVPKPVLGLHVAAYIGLVKQGLSNYKNGLIPTRPEIIRACHLLVNHRAGTRECRIPTRFTSKKLSKESRE